MIRKDLLFIFPFYIFNLEKELRTYDKLESRTKVISSFTELLEYVNDLYKKSRLAFDKYLLLTDMIKKVADSLSMHYDKARKELDDLMGGKILEFKGERIYNQGREEGREEGRKEGREEGKIEDLLDLAYDNIIPADVAASRAETRYNISKNDFMKMLESYKPDDDLMQG